jgi:AraC-like DNA-binding protein
MSSPDGITFGYYNVLSSAKGEIIIDNLHPFLQLSYVISGRKSYSVANGKQVLVSLDHQQYNYLFLADGQVHLTWEPGEHLEIFELGISPELFNRFLPVDHPLYSVFTANREQNTSAAMSSFNLPLTPQISSILYQLLHCPLEHRYKQLYVKAKTMEILMLQLEQYEQLNSITSRQPALKKEEIERMYLARDIILRNLDNPCSIIDLAYQVGTNENYLKTRFKQLFGTTVYGYLQHVKMEQAKEMLLQGKTVSEASYGAGYKHVGHFTRAFKKHFGFPPNKVKG